MILTRLFFPVFILWFAACAVFGQSKGDIDLARSMSGSYSGLYMSRKAKDMNAVSLDIRHLQANRLKVDESLFGPFEFTVKNSGKDTLFFSSTIPGMKIKYIKPKGRILINSTVNGEATSFTGRFSYKDQADLERQKIKNDSIIQSRKEHTRYYGTYYGKVTKPGSDQPVMDTVVVIEYENEFTQGNYKIQDRMAAITSKSNAFKTIRTNVKLMENGNKIVQYNNNSLVFRIDYSNQVMFFEDKLSGVQFEGVQVQGRSK